MQETFLQLGLLKMTFEGVDQNRVEIEQELKEIKRLRRLPDSETDHYHMVIDDLNQLITSIDSEMQGVEHDMLEKRTELEAVRKEHLGNVREAAKEVETMT